MMISNMHDQREAMMTNNGDGVEQSFKTRGSSTTNSTTSLTASDIFHESFVTANLGTGSSHHGSGSRGGSRSCQESYALLDESYVTHATADELLGQMEYNRKMAKRTGRRDRRSGGSSPRSSQNSRSSNSKRDSDGVPTLVVIGNASAPASHGSPRKPMGDYSYNDDRHHRHSHRRSLESARQHHRNNSHGKAGSLSPMRESTQQARDIVFPRNGPRHAPRRILSHDDRAFRLPLPSTSFGSTNTAGTGDSRLSSVKESNNNSVLTRISRTLAGSSTSSKKCTAHVTKIEQVSDDTKEFTLLLLTSRVPVHDKQQYVSLYDDAHRRMPGIFRIVSLQANTLVVAVAKDKNDPTSMASFLYDEDGASANVVKEGMKLKLL